MHIRVDDTVSENVACNTNGWVALTNLLTAFREGWHSVYFGDAVREALTAESAQLSALERATLQRMGTSRFELGRLHDSLQTYVEITRLTGRIEKQGRLIDVPLEHFFALTNAAATKLYLEDIDDHAAMRPVLDAAKVASQLTHVVVHYDPASAGGSRAATVYEHEVHSRAGISLFILDSDQSNPNSPMGSTAASFNSAVNAIGDSYPLAWGIAMSARELENLVPTSVLSDLCAGRHAGFADGVEFLEQMNSEARDEHTLYLDLKDGVSFARMADWRSECGGGQFWDTVCITRVQVMRGVDTSCVALATCDAQSCKCEVLPPMGAFLGAASRLMASASSKKLWEGMSKSQRKVLATIADIVTAWCCARAAARAI